MSYQKCPICNGTGISQTLTSNYGKCHSCNGFGLINELTGLPPKETVTNNFSTLISNTDFRDGNMESQQEYFGQK